VGLSMPDEDQLSPGPLRELTAAIHALYQSAGMPGTRKISDEIRKRNDLTDTVSHEGIRGILMGGRARWAKVESLVVQLAALSVTRPDPRAEATRIHELWIAAERASSEEALADDAQRVQHSKVTPQLAMDPMAADNVPAPTGTQSIISMLREVIERPLISIELKVGTLNIYDRQVAVQVATEIIKDIGAAANE
jgi:hypothetical protein